MGNSDDKIGWQYFPKLKTAEEISTYLDGRLNGHDKFCHYTSLGAINSILKTKTFRISSVDRFNDKKDTEQFNHSEKLFYSFCFTSGVNENLSLWYLYSGIDGKGGRISFTNSKLMKLIDDGEFFLVEYDYDEKKIIGKEKQLIKGENMEISFRDVLYARQNGNSKYVDMKYNTMTNHNNVSISEYEKYKKSHIGFNKRIIWYYEKESRLLIKLTNDAAQYVESQKDYAILWKLTDKQIADMKIMIAPEIVSLDEVEHKYEYIKKFMQDSSRINLSANSGDIEMKICDRCDYKNSGDSTKKNGGNQK